MCPGISKMGGKNEWWKSMKCVKNENWWWRVEQGLQESEGWIETGGWGDLYISNDEFRFWVKINRCLDKLFREKCYENETILVMNGLGLKLSQWRLVKRWLGSGLDIIIKY
jgi:hypothetical protein